MAEANASHGKGGQTKIRCFSGHSVVTTMNNLPFLGNLFWGKSKTPEEEGYEEREEDSDSDYEHETLSINDEELDRLTSMYEQMLLGNSQIVEDDSEKLTKARNNLLQQRKNCANQYDLLVRKRAKELAEGVIRSRNQAFEDEQKRVTESIERDKQMLEDARRNRPKFSPPRRL